jgi:hypothetical protein
MWVDEFKSDLQLRAKRVPCARRSLEGLGEGLDFTLAENRRKLGRSKRVTTVAFQVWLVHEAFAVRSRFPRQSTENGNTKFQRCNTCGMNSVKAEVVGLSVRRVYRT